MVFGGNVHVSLQRTSIKCELHNIILKVIIVDNHIIRCTLTVEHIYFKRLVTQAYDIIDNFGSARL